MPIIKCPKCHREGAVGTKVLKYIWKTDKFDIEDGYITIENANIFRCGKCGEGPIDKEEKRRWTMIAYKQESEELGKDENHCDFCGQPESMTGQFFTLGLLEEDKIRYCGKCYEDKMQKA